MFVTLEKEERPRPGPQPAAALNRRVAEYQKQTLERNQIDICLRGMSVGRAQAEWRRG